jgi:MFS transporter, DHA1 family, solute carrier family 18 (vesicular amine transporter), member 1/2
MADLAEAADPPAYGAAYALYTLAYSAGLTAAPLLAGLAAGTWDFTTAVTGGAAVAITAGLALMTPAMRRLTAVGQV